MFNTSDIANDATFVAGDYFDAEAKELYKLWKPAKLIGLKNFDMYSSKKFSFNNFMSFNLLDFI